MDELKEWMLRRRAELKGEHEKAMAMANRIAGALIMLDEALAKLDEPQPERPDTHPKGSG